MQGFGRLGILLTTQLILLTANARGMAQTNPEAADARFNEAVKLIDAKDYKRACPLFLESYGLDPVPGTLHALADCLALNGQTASALRRFEEYIKAVDALPPASQARHADRMVSAKDQVVKLQKEVPQVILELPALAPSDTRVEEDGNVLDISALAQPRLLDPGEHMVRVNIPGKEPWETKFSVDKGEKKTIKLRLFRETQSAEPVKPDASAPEAPVQTNGGMSKIRQLGIVVGGIGVTGLIAGGVTGVLAWGKAKDAKVNCSRDAGTQTLLCNSAESKSAMESAQTMATVSTAAFIAGGVLSAAGATLWILGGGKKDEKQGNVQARIQMIRLGPNQTMVGVEGVW